MKISSNTVLHRVRPEGGMWSIAESVRALGRAGFEAVEVNLAEAIQPESFFQRDGWEAEIDAIGLAAAEAGLEISQSHLPFYNFATPGHPDLERKAQMFGRTIEASGRLGVRWAVFHAGNAPDAVLAKRESKRRTLEYIAPFVEQAQRLGVGIAIENLFIPEYLNSTRRYCAHVEDVIDLCDALGGAGCVCWDFGHANLVRDDQADCLRAVGKRLKLLHVHDNNGKHDDHAPPFVPGGTVDWERILPVLAEIGYEGNFNFEVTAGRMPAGLRDSLERHLAEMGRYMVSRIRREDAPVSEGI